ncbi:MAG: glycoside hydrolase family 2 TIM barrel-domain containing protein [Chitinophagaceae bacterium]
MKRISISLLALALFIHASSQETIIKYLSGRDKDHTVSWDFYCSAGRNSGKWTTIPVPSNWELRGFGTYNYGHDKVKASEQGLYKYEFPSENWQGKKTFIVFEGSMTDTKVSVNGIPAGAVHQGAFYRFKYDITKLLKPAGKNLLEVTVDKTSANASVNNAERKSDYWIFGGIYRPVYLEIVPEVFIERMAINARADGSFVADVYLQNLKGDENIEAQVQTLNGTNVGRAFSIAADKAPEHLELKSAFTKPHLWSAEFPNLYQVIVTIKKGQRILHRVKQKFGFRTVELRINDGLYVNNEKIVLKGSNRHSFWPESGRTLSHAVHLMDVKLMKDMNMNAVRMSHYPPDQDFLDVCDSLGLYVLNELAGWQAKYDTIVGRRLVKELVVRDVNHPSVIIWDNGNEGGWNTALDNDYNLYDPQKRIVIHPWGKFNGTETKHYPDYNYIVKSVAEEKEVFFTTEFMHGLYDGGAGAGLDDFWSLMLKHPYGAGGFMWALVDEAVVRTDKDGTYDSDGNHGADGILGPHREKEASFYTIKEIWSPAYIDLPSIEESFSGQVPLENRYAFTNLNQCSFDWKLVTFPTANDKTTKAFVKASGRATAPNVRPGEKGLLNLILPATWLKNDALYLTSYGPDKRELFTWSWTITTPEVIAQKRTSSPVGPSIQPLETNSDLRITCDGVNYYFDKATGFIQKVIKNSGPVSLSGGPVLAGVNTVLKNFSHKAVGKQYIVEADYGGTAPLHIKWTFASGQAVKLEYQYTQTGEADFMGITFNYPEEKITGMKWLGRGPYRVWKNRLKGQAFGVWHKAYNNSITGESFKYPEFKGYHAQVNWVKIESRESPFTVYTSNKNMYLQMLHPAREKDALQNNNVEPPFPQGSIGFLQAIPAIGTKFQAAKVMGPQSQKTVANGQQITGTLWFDFGR